MSFNLVIQLAAYLLLVTIISVPLGLYMARVFSHERTFLDPVLSPLERLIYKICGINPGVEMGWVGYAASMLAFSLISMIFLYALQRLQYYLPFNPQNLAGVLGRADDELPHPNARAHLAQLSFGRGGNCDGGRCHPRIRPPQREDPWKFLGRSHS